MRRKRRAAGSVFTDELSKPLVPLNGQPLLAHLLRYISLAGIVRFLVCVGYKANAIESFLNEHRQSSWELTFVNSGDASMTDRLVDARAHLSNRALVCYGDTLANVDVPGLLAAHEQSGALATLTIHPLNSPFGIVETFDNLKRSAIAWPFRIRLPGREMRYMAKRAFNNSRAVQSVVEKNQDFGEHIVSLVAFL